MKDTINIQVSREQAEILCSLITDLNGRLQYRAMKTPDGSLDDSWKFWNKISKQLSTSFGYEAFMHPSKKIDDLIIGI
jgi:hypothetical protein